MPPKKKAPKGKQSAPKVCCAVAVSERPGYPGRRHDFYNPSHVLYQKLLTILSSFSLTQVVPSPTHTTPCTGKSTLIDLALVFSPAAVDCSVIPPIGNSGHLGVHLTIRNQRSAKCTGLSRSIWRYSAADWDRACELLNSIDWNEIFSGDINHA